MIQPSLASLIFLSFIFCSPLCGQELMYSIFGKADDEKIGVGTFIGDLNADGCDDFLVGHLRDGMTQHGLARAYSGKDGTVIYEWFSKNPGERLGNLIGLSDLDGDLVPEIAMSFLDDRFSPFHEGYVQIYSGKDNILLWENYGMEDLINYGVGLGNAGDVNNDGVDDILIGAQGASIGAERVGYVEVRSGVLTPCPPDPPKFPLIYFIDGGDPKINSPAGSRFGGSVDGVGDLNNDGFDDFVVGAVNEVRPGAPGGEIRHGAVRVFSGIDCSLMFNTPIFGPNDRDQLGISLQGGDDINNDGTPDIYYGVSENSGAFNGGNGSIVVRSGVDFSIIYEREGLGQQDGFYRIGSAGDWNDDGYPELVVGADQASVNFTSGYAWVLDGQFMTNNGPSRITGPTQPGETLFEGTGRGTGGRGARFSGFLSKKADGDANGDGFEDVLIPAVEAPNIYASPWFELAGYVDLYSSVNLEFSSDLSNISQSLGGTITLNINPQNHPSGFYWVLGSVSGTSPGFRLGAITMPLNKDDYTVQTSFPGLPPLSNANGVFDQNNLPVQAQFTLPPNSTVFAGYEVIHHAYVLIVAGQLYPSDPRPIFLHD